MEVAQIEAFDRVVREGSFTRAADALGLTQPAISTRITTLEGELGGALFERQGRTLRLTPLGERFLPYAQRMLAVMADGLQEVQNFHKGRLGQVKIAAPAPFVLSFLVDVLDDYRKQHPTIDIFIRERPKTSIFEMLYDRVVILGLVNAPVFDGYFTHLARFKDPICAVVAPSHPLAKHPLPVRIEDIYRHTIFRVSMFPEMTAFMDAVVEQGRQGSGGAVIAVPMVMALRLVILGQGITFLPESYIRTSVETGELVQIQLRDMPPLVSQPILITHRDRQLDETHQEFVRIFKNRWQHLLASAH